MRSLPGGGGGIQRHGRLGLGVLWHAAWVSVGVEESLF